MDQATRGWQVGNGNFKGIPSGFRAPVYLKTLQVRYKFNQDNTFGELSKRSSKFKEDILKLSDKQEIVELVLLVSNIMGDVGTNVLYKRRRR